MTAPPKIASQGIYPHLSIDDYHGSCCVGPSISASGLARLLDCPARYWAESPLNPARVVKETAAFAFGRAAHALFLGEPEFAAYYVLSPYDDFRSKEAREWRDDQERTIVKARDMDVIHAMVAAMRATPQTARAFQSGKPEVSIIWHIDGMGIWLKSRPDWLPADPSKEFVAEYKTTVSIEPRRLSNDVFRYGYDIQAALVVDGITAVTGKKPLGVAHIVQEKEPPFLCDLRMFTPEQLDIGRTRYLHALRIFARCLERMEAGDPPHIAWPGYTTAPQYFSTPKWASDLIMEFEDNDDDGNDFGQTLAAG